MLLRRRRGDQLRAAFQKRGIVGNKVKAEQLAATGVETFVAPCHNCLGGLNDIIQYYKLDMKLKFLGDIIYECMERPEG